VQRDGAGSVDELGATGGGVDRGGAARDEGLDERLAEAAVGAGDEGFGSGDLHVVTLGPDADVRGKVRDGGHTCGSGIWRRGRR
jgi:hypothetical protein